MNKYHLICKFSFLLCFSLSFLTAEESPNPEGWAWFQMPLENKRVIKFLSPISIPSVTKNDEMTTFITRDQHHNIQAITVFSSTKYQPTLINILMNFMPQWKQELLTKGYQPLDCHIYKKDGNYYIDTVLKSDPSEGNHFAKERHIFTENSRYTLGTIYHDPLLGHHQEFVDSFQFNL
jgi:hypothetical protein